MRDVSAASTSDPSAAFDAGLGVPQPPRRVRHDTAVDGAASGVAAGSGTLGLAAGEGVGSTAGFFLKKLNMVREEVASAAAPEGLWGRPNAGSTRRYTLALRRFSSVG